VEHALPLRPRDLIDFSPILEGIRYVRRDPKLTATLFVKWRTRLPGVDLVLLPLLGQRVFPIRMQGLDAQRGAMLGMSLTDGRARPGRPDRPLSLWRGRRQSEPDRLGDSGSDSWPSSSDMRR